MDGEFQMFGGPLMLSFFFAPASSLTAQRMDSILRRHTALSLPPASSQGEVFGIYLKATEYYFLSRCCINTKHNQGSSAWNYDKGLSKSSRKETCVLIIRRYLPSATQTYSFLSLSWNSVAGSERSHTATAMSSSFHLIPLHLFLYFLFVFSFSLPFPTSFPFLLPLPLLIISLLSPPPFPTPSLTLVLILLLSS